MPQPTGATATRRAGADIPAVSDRETGYELDIDNQYIMSPKDLCTISFLDQIIDAGARVLKIEGRARPPEYVKTVTRCYSEAAAAVADGEPSDRKRLRSG